MAFRFRKRIRVMPGIYLNLGKNGVSTTIGPRGANINIGKGGAYLNTGIPGTGFSDREKLFGGKSNTTNPSFSNNEQTLVEEPIAEQELTTSEGLVGLKEHIEEASNDRQELVNEIKQTQENLNQLQNDLEKKQNGFFSKLFTKKETVENLEKEVEETSAYLEDIKKQYEESQADINIHFDEELEDQYKKVVAAFRQLTTSNKIWDITTEIANNETKSAAKTTVSRQEVKFNTENIDFIKSAFPAFHFQNANGSQIYIYPAFVLTIDTAKNLSLIDIKELNFSFRPQRFLESKETIPSDTNIIDHTWAKVNKNGTPDMRFVGNYQIPVVKYGEYQLTASNGLSEAYNISNFEFAETFANEFLTYVSMLKNPTGFSATDTNSSAIVSQQEFEKIKSFADKHVQLVVKLETNKAFLNNIYQSQTVKDLPFETPKEMLHFFFVLDLMKCFSLTADITDLKSKEAFALLYTISKKNGLEIENYAQHKMLYDDKLLSTYDAMYQSLKSQIEMQMDDSAMFRLSLLLSAYDKDIQEQYLTNLYRFASIVVKIDGTVTKEEEVALKKIMSLNAKSEEKNKNDEAPKTKGKVSEPLSQKTVDEALEDLNSLTGLTAVKEEIKSLINFIKVQKAREDKGFKSSSLSYHIVFTGNPGTGKTTVARIVAQIYKALGVLQQGQLVETDRSGLIAEYVGQTAVKVNKTVDSALNGVLFIDEAYSIVGDTQDSFGKEAVSTLIKRMEDDRDKLIVVLAGYTKEMQDFIETNPGFKSRFNRYIDFTDYKPDELLSIFEGLCKKLDYKLTDEAKVKLTTIFTTAYNNRDKSFGNGRFVRNTFEKSMERQANRIASVADLTDEVLTTITADDVPDK